MMANHDLPTPAPSSDPPMPGSSPVKALRHAKALPASAHRSISSAMPFTPLDLNRIGDSAKAFQQERQQAGATPPPSSPPPATAPSSALVSSPVRSTATEAQLRLGFSPTKQQRVLSVRDSTTSAPQTPRQVSANSASGTLLELSSGKETVGLVSNPELETEADVVPHLLFASKNLSLIIGRSKPSGQPHTYNNENNMNSNTRQQDEEEVSQSLNTASALDIPSSTQGLGAKKILRVNLPNDARHVSRVHAIVEWIPFVSRSLPAKKTSSVSSFTAKGSPKGVRLSAAASIQQEQSGTFIVRIVGQNGLIVDGKRRREGQVLRLTPGKTLIDFFGVKCRFEYVATRSELQAASAARSFATAKARSEQRIISPTKRASLTTFSPSIDEDELPELPSSPPPTSPPPAVLQHSSPRKTSAAPRRLTTDFLETEEEEGEEEGEGEDITSSPTPFNRKAAGGLKVGPLAITKVKAGTSDQEEEQQQDDNQDDEDEDESDDEDYIPEAFSTPSKRARNAQASKMAVADEDSSSLSDSDIAIVDEEILVDKTAAPTLDPTPGKRDHAASRTKEDASRELSTKEANVEALTESQIKMPPPAAFAAVRASARRSASNSPAPSSPLLGSSIQDLQTLARRCVRQLAPTYDLAGLLAGAIVFHRTATISASEAVRSVLSTTPGLMKGEAGEHSVAFSPSKRKLPGSATLQHGCVVEGWPIASGDATNDRWASIARKAWREHLEVVLQSSPMFGVIQRAGKDASGNPLECWYYYDKENDPDKERAENLGVFAKPMRKALKGQKPIFWKRSGYASRQQEEVVETKPTTSAEASIAATRASASTSLAESLPIGGDAESIEIATGPLPSSSIRKRKAQSQARSAINTEESQLDREEKKREKLRAKIAKSGLWDETQPEEAEKPTWDRKGDQDYRKGRK